MYTHMGTNNNAGNKKVLQVQRHRSNFKLNMDLKNNLQKEPGSHWIRVVVSPTGDVLLDNVIISHKLYLKNYLFTEEELALYHITSYNEGAE